MSNLGYSPVSLPLVAILRGLRAEDAPAFGSILFGAGFRLLEVQLNRPGAIEAIRALIAIAPLMQSLAVAQCSRVSTLIRCLRQGDACLFHQTVTPASSPTQPRVACYARREWPRQQARLRRSTPGPAF